ncbi:hypothetical protein CEUSTIGMA_g4865.t1 [Chlamydomonas eustigma]|uniref:HTH La-type RNA-binding domain-containing protein n=1 Tax=Chlamydomonas eustigma TaxID=1157962 RepID=A0A250X3S9_9CHLO|nr:hypothetical protein CEUSTIGMA_g4865.t1 [Chlamydomonas eustigma]|eukprot:GAX77420.1 hypothetical protein CEUSTIGMA_g4865.t1 [Chlamydomonas eustigma]
MVQMDESSKKKLLRQIEFYFSDSNLPKDKFLKEKIAADAEGYVDLSIVCAFARMKDILKLAKDTTPEKVSSEAVAATAEVVKTSSSLLSVNEEGTRVKRKEALRSLDVIAKEVDARSLYVRPFPMDTSIDQITTFFSTQAEVNGVRLRRHPSSKTFKGSAFVEFESVEAMQKVAAMKLEFEGAELHLEQKPEYLARKKTERQQGSNGAAEGDTDGEEMAEDEPAPGADGPVGRKRGRQAGGAGSADAGPKAKVAKEGEDGGEDTAAGMTFVPGHLLHFTMEATLPEAVDIRTLVTMLGGKEKIKYLEMNEDKKSGFLRFPNPDAACKALEEFLAKPEVERTMAGTRAEWRRVEGSEEEEYYKRAKAAHVNKQAKDREGGGRGGGRGGSGRGGRGGRRGGGRGRK